MSEPQQDSMRVNEQNNLPDNLMQPNAAQPNPAAGYFSPLPGQKVASNPTETFIKAQGDVATQTALAVKEAMHDVIDPELGIDVVDLGLLYGVEIDELGRAILTMTLTTPTCPLTDMLEDETASVLAGIVDQFRIDWVWSPVWTLANITPDGQQQLAALGFNFA